MGTEIPTSRRIGAPKSRTGCKTCKIRKVKCGEEKPSCLRCSTTGRKCDYEDETPSTGPFTPSALIPSDMLSLSPNSGRRERRAFEYYFQYASTQLASGMSIDFWTTVVPQICRSEPAVWDAMIAISALFEYPDQCLDFTYLRNQRQQPRSLTQVQQEALVWYSRSISSIQSQFDRRGADPYIALISCILFICIETMQGRVEEALQLYRQGVSLVFDLRAQVGHGRVSASKAALLEETIIPLFLRLGAISLTISGVQANGLYRPAEIEELSAFQSVDAARLSITVLSTEAQLLEREAQEHLTAVGGDSAASKDMIYRQQSLLNKLTCWHRAYINMCHGVYPGSSVPLNAEPVLLTYYAASFIYVSECLTQRELVYDYHIERFRTIVEQAVLALAATAGPTSAQPPFTFEMGVGIPLFLTGLKCRDPLLRRKALKLLRQAPPMQGFFKCTPVAQLAESLMKIEESYSLALGRHTGSHMATIPEEARICKYGIFRPENGLPPGVAEEDIAGYNCGPGQVFLVYWRNCFDGNSNTWKKISHAVPIIN
ncbi:hypothetical protein N7532_008024 [Penicillium argentinense]|uniref:Zn(2)-C6 fungal-type domain-containing protein n=1 Tax=Penicillium argentinense TaxID=1131581 RepID=A0A9W9K1G8_9EURO|nr:uncharacterized protein N7532_008024 [Penicillium argentinense]KAJ5089340.1 hypothetical protein N7532_008024 [Penicillium argentinense]